MRTVFPVLNEIVRRCTACGSFAELVEAPGGYRPSVYVTDEERLLLAAAYDLVQRARGDERRAYVPEGHLRRFLELDEAGPEPESCTREAQASMERVADERDARQAQTLDSLAYREAVDRELGLGAPRTQEDREFVASFVGKGRAP